MHRSGTSALTGVLGLCGATLPRHLGVASHESNPLGHWEPQKIVDIHDRFLKSAGTGWDSILSYPDAIFRSKSAIDCRHNLLKVARAEYGNSSLFVLKDPRTSRLMRLWRPVLSEMGVGPRVVIIVRNPLEIADSLSRRDAWSEYRSLLVWVRYLLSAERETRDMPRCFVNYDQLINDWRSVVKILSSGLDIELPVRSPATDSDVDRFLRKDLRHHRRDPQEFLGRNDIADCLKRAYRCFSAAANTGRIDCAALDNVAQELDEAEATFKHISRSADAAVLHTISPEQAFTSKQDALLAIVLADFGRANDTAEHSKRKLDEIMRSRSWRFTRAFRVFGRTTADIFRRVQCLLGVGKTLPSR